MITCSREQAEAELYARVASAERLAIPARDPQQAAEGRAYANDLGMLVAGEISTEAPPLFGISQRAVGKARLSQNQRPIGSPRKSYFPARILVKS